MANSLCSSGDDDDNGSNSANNSKRIPPWIMLPYPLSPSDHDTRVFFSLASHHDPHAKYYHHRLHLPELRREVFHGLNHGSWVLVMSRGYKNPHHLFNLFTRARIPLPPLPLPTTPFSSKEDEDELKFAGPEFYMPKVSLAVLSSDPSNSETFKVMVVYGRESKLAFCWSGDAEWSLVSLRDSGEIIMGIRAATYCNGRFYVADKDNIFVCDDDSSVVTATLVSRLPRPPKGKMMVYLVCIDEELVLVVRNWTNGKSDYFYVYKMIKEKEEKEEVEQLVKEHEREEGIKGGGGGEEGMEVKKEEEDVEEGFLFGEMYDFTVEEEHDKEREKKKEEEEKWLRVYSVGERALFLSQESSFVISTRGLGLVDCVPSSIYYFDVFSRGHGYGNTVVRLEEFNIRENKRVVIDCYPWASSCIWSPIWIQPCQLLKREQYEDDAQP